VTTGPRGIAELARLYNVEMSYEDMNGTRQRADTDALIRTLQALGAALDSARGVREALRVRRAELDTLAIQPVQVAWDGVLPVIHVRLPHGGRERMAWQLHLESGELIAQECNAEPAARRARAGWQATHTVRLDRRLPLGYHQLQVETRAATFETLVVAAPRHAYVPADAREWGIFVPLYALCSNSSQAVGDYSDLRSLTQWVGELGGGFVSTLPLLATFLDAPFEPSPYSPASRLFWNELFIDTSVVPGGDAAASRDDPAAPCEAAQLVDYRRAAAYKRKRLEQALHRCAGDMAVQDQLRQFVAANPRVEDYARFRAVCDRRREGWHLWPDRLRDGTIHDDDFAPEDRQYHLFAQWQADYQLAAIDAVHARGAAALYLDMPLGVNPDGYDAWRFHDLFADGVSAGAPPDPLFTGGQNWGFRPLNPRAIRASGYGYLIETFRHHLRHARMLRLDHVMSLYRLFWVPDGLSAKDGVYVRYPDEELFAVLVLESARHRAVVIGEDLGTVPAAVRRAMDRHHVQRMHVVQFEASPDSTPPVPPSPGSVVASLNTHDMPLFAGFWRGSEIDDQLDLSLIDEQEHAELLHKRAQLRLSLSRSVAGGGEIDVGVARQRLLERLASSPARYVVVSLEDMWLEDRPQNVPGTADERPNWRRRAARDLNAIIEDAALRRMLTSIGQRRQPTSSLSESHD
jgi:4-alpha-glucanotransferase